MRRIFSFWVDTPSACGGVVHSKIKYFFVITIKQVRNDNASYFHPVFCITTNSLYSRIPQYLRGGTSQGGTLGEPISKAKNALDLQIDSGKAVLYLFLSNDSIFRPRKEYSSADETAKEKKWLKAMGLNSRSDLMNLPAASGRGILMD